MGFEKRNLTNFAMLFIKTESVLSRTCSVFWHIQVWFLSKITFVSSRNSEVSFHTGLISHLLESLDYDVTVLSWVLV